MYSRIVPKPPKTFLLLGPRGTGKSTWLRQQKFALTIDLLKSRTRIDLERDPGLIHQWAAHLKPGDWVLIDEVQKVPALLDEAHSLYEEKRLQFALSGSSARKLKRSGANLLGGRALQYRFFPLVFPEYQGSISWRDRMEFGTLPLVLDQPEVREETLDTYVDTYLRQEIIEEGVVRKLEPFSRLLQVAAMRNGQILNIENIAREARVGRTTVDTYFEILYDTLIGYRLPAYQPGIKAKETAHPKFYFFDSGVARAAAGLTREPIDSALAGFFFETFLLNEVRAYSEYSRKKRELFYYSVSGGGDIDLIIQLEKKTVQKQDTVIAVEFKMRNQWDSSWTRQLESFRELKGFKNVIRVIGVYTGERRLRSGGVDVLPVDDFLGELFSGKIF